MLKLMHGISLPYGDLLTSFPGSLQLLKSWEWGLGMRPLSPSMDATKKFVLCLSLSVFQSTALQQYIMQSKPEFHYKQGCCLSQN